MINQKDMEVSSVGRISDDDIKWLADRIGARNAARTTDPETSWDAADKVSRTMGVIDAVNRVTQSPSLTAAEHVQEAADKGMKVCRATGISKRISDAERAGLIMSAGVRLCTQSGRKARTWRIV